MQDQRASAPQIVDLDRDRQSAASASSLLLTPQSVANLSPSFFSSPLPNAPLVSQKRASRRAQRPSTTSSLNPIAPPSPPSPNQVGSPIVSSSCSSFSDSQPHASSRHDSDLTTDSPHKGLRPKSSYHQSLLNLCDELPKTSDSGVYHSRAAPVGIRALR